MTAHAAPSLHLAQASTPTTAGMGIFEDAAYVSIRQHTSAYVSIRQHTSAYGAGKYSDNCWNGHLKGKGLAVSIRPHTSAYVRIRQHTSAYVSKNLEGKELATRTRLFVFMYADVC
jgi:hypothetical protein